MVRLDYLTIFPDYLAPLALALVGRAEASGLVETHVHDLRTWTHDRHRTVDDAPYGGGAGMVMRPEPWGEAFDALGVDGATVVVPTPAGRPMSHRLAEDLAGRARLVFCCGRYEGIDQRVLDHAAERAELVEVSLGDYVLNGGEVAALAVTEAVVRLLPGFVGNAASLEEESHRDGLLEYPTYTRPAHWRGHDVPAPLLSGDHGAVAAWRADAARRRTASRRPDLLHASTLAGSWEVVPAVRADAPELHVLSLACWVTEALVNDDLGIPTLHEQPADTLASLAEWDTYVVRSDGRLVASVRGRSTGGGEVWEIGRLMVAPDLRGQGLGRLLLAHVQRVAPEAATSFRLFTGRHSGANLRRYQRDGFRVVEVRDDGPAGPVVLVKPR